MSKLRKVILIIVIMAAAYFVVTFVASLVQYSSNLAKSGGWNKNGEPADKMVLNVHGRMIVLSHIHISTCKVLRWI